MERRLVLAVVLMVVVAVLPSLFIKPAPRRPGTPGAPASPAAAPSPAGAAPGATPSNRAGPESTGVAAPRGPARGSPRRGAPPATRPAADTTLLVTGRARYRFTAVGAVLDRAELPGYRSFAPGGGPVSLLRPGERLLVHRLVAGADTVRLDSVRFALARQGGGARFEGAVGSLRVALGYAPHPARDFLLDVTGTVGGLEGRGALLLVSLGTGFANLEGDSLDNYRHYAVAVRRTSLENRDFRSLDSGVTTPVEGPFDWVAVKSKYFIGALLSPDSTRPLFGGALLTGGPRQGRIATRADTWVTLPVGPDGTFRYQLYLGPQEYRALHPLGRELDRASPYGGFVKGIVMPVAVWITQLLLWMHENLRLAYGWVLVLFGILVRLLLWPLNQKAMKSSVAMQAIQPLLKDLQARYKDDPQKLQQEMMKLYREHKVNPLGGCLPMLLPFPILLALFFVFANTIEFRGVSFLWLPDLSQRDPLYVIPAVMGISMYALTKLGQMGMPPNPQTKMMTTVMPIMMTVLFLNFASGLNLYYAVSNLVSLPQQYIINKSREAEMARRAAKR